MPGSVICRNCRRPVAVTHLKIRHKIEVEYGHGISVDGVECTYLDPIIVDELSPDQVLICDFCCAPSPEWSYPCQDFNIPIKIGTFVVGSQSIDYNLVGWWAACDRCRKHIDAEDWEGTARRYVLNQMLEPDFRVNAFSSLVELHQTFGKHRTGHAIENVKGAH